MHIRYARLKMGRILGAAVFILTLSASLGAAITYMIQESEQSTLRQELKKAQSALEAARKSKSTPLPRSQDLPTPPKKQPQPKIDASPVKLKTPQERLEFQRLQEYRRRMANGEPRGKILFEMAKLYHSLGAVEEAMRRLQDCLEVDDPINEQPDFFHALGRAYHDLAEEDEAYEHFTEAADLAPSQSAHLRARASLSLHIGELDKAVRDITVALQRDPENHLNHQVKGHIAQAQLQFDGAERCYKKSLALLASQPSAASHSVRLDLAELYGIQGLHSKAIGQAHAVLTQAPKHSRALFIHGRLSLATEDYAYAKSYFEAALAVEEEWHDRLSTLEELGLAQALPRDAFKNSLLFEKRAHRARLLAHLALIEARQGDLEQAKTLAARALTFDSRQAIALPILKQDELESFEIHQVLLENHGRFFHQPSASHFYKRAEELLAGAKESQSTPSIQAALKAFKVVLWQMPTHGLAMTKKAQCHAYLGQFAQALDFTRISLFITPDQADAFELQARLHSHRIAAFKGQASTLKKRPQLALNTMKIMAQRCQQSQEKARAHFLAAQIHFDSQAYLEALTAIQASRRVAPKENTPHTLEHLAALSALQTDVYKALGRKNDVKRSEALLLKLNVKRAKLRDQHYRLAQALCDQRKYNNALQEFQLALAFNDHRAQIHYDLGVTYLKIGNFIPGVLAVMDAVERDPYLARKVAIKVNPRQCHFVDPKRVIEELDKLIKVHPNRATVLTLRAYFYCFYRTQFKPQKHSKDPVTKGVADCDRALQINPDFHLARLIRADLLSYGGDFESASLDYDRLLKALPQWDTALSSQGIHFYRLSQRSKGKQAKEYRAAALGNFRRCTELKFMDFQHRQDPIMKVLRDDAEFQNLLKAIGQ